MKFSAIILSLLALAAAPALHAAPFVPTPKMSVSWKKSTKDTREWVMQHPFGSSKRILAEFIHKGDNIEQWKELLINQVDFTKVSLDDYVKGWKAMLLKADPKMKITEETLPDGSFLMTFLTVAQTELEELQVRHFMKGSDAIYQLAYSVRPSLKKDEIWNEWLEIVTQAKLIPNPILKHK